MIELEKATDFAKEQSKDVIESGEKHVPIIIALTPEGLCMIHLARMDKNRFKQEMAAILRQLDAYAYLFINEAWSTRLPKDSPIASKLSRGEISVSELPLDDKQEILSILVAENGKSLHYWSAKILYTHDDKRFLGEWEEKNFSDAKGRLILKEW